MSVTVQDRNQQSFSVLTNADKLANHTINICFNEKNFPKKYRQVLSNELARYAIGIALDVKEANDIKVKSRRDYLERRELQNKVLSKCGRMLHLMQIAIDSVHFDAKRAEYWTSLAMEVQRSVAPWMESDMKRYGKFAPELNEQNN